MNTKIHKKIIDNNKKSYLSYLNKLVDEYNNSSNLTEEFERSPKLTKFKVGDRVRITKYRNTFSKGFTENWSKELFIIDSVLKKWFTDYCDNAWIMLQLV